MPAHLLDLLSKVRLCRLFHLHQHLKWQQQWGGMERKKGHSNVRSQLVQPWKARRMATMLHCVLRPDGDYMPAHETRHISSDVRQPSQPHLQAPPSASTHHGRDLFCRKLLVLPLELDINHRLLGRPRNHFEGPVRHVILDSWVREAATDEALCIKHSVAGIHCRLVLGGVAHQTFSVSEGDIGGRCAVSLQPNIAASQQQPVSGGRKGMLSPEPRLEVNYYPQVPAAAKPAGKKMHAHLIVWDDLYAVMLPHTYAAAQGSGWSQG